MEIYNPELGTSLMTMSFGTKPKLLFLFQGFAILMGLASALAALPVAVLSFGFYGAALFLGRIRAFRDASGFLSRAYERVLDRLGQRVLRDSRDTPALRLMVSLSLTAMPIFVIQLVLGKPRPLLAIAFYLSLYGLKFQRFVRMFSASRATFRRNTTKSSAATSNSSWGISMGTFRNWAGRLMCVSTIERTADPTTLATRWATIEPAGSISYGISRTTVGRFWGLLPTPTLEREAMKRTEGACCGEWRATMLISGLFLFTIGELGRCSYWFLFSA